MFTNQITRRLRFVALPICLWLAAPATTAGEPVMRDETATPEFLRLPDWDAPYPFSARNLPLATALKLFSKNLRIGLAMADGVEGEISDPTPPDMTRLEYIEALALDFDFVWYFDGAVLRISPVGATETRVLPLAKHEGYQVIESLRSLDIYQPKFVHRYGKRSRTLRVTGPIEYIKLVESAVEAIDKVERQKIQLVRGSVAGTLEDTELAQ